MARSEILQPLTFLPLSATARTFYGGKTMTLIEAVDAAMADTVKACARLGSKGRVSVALSFEPKKGAMEVSAIVTTKKPEGGSIPVRAYVDRQGRLVEDDPEQERLPFTEPTPIRGTEK